MGPPRGHSDRWNWWSLKKGKRIKLALTLMMKIFIIIPIYLVRRLIEKITDCAEALMRILLTTLSNHADIWFVPTASRKKTINYVVSINSRSPEPTGDTENGCATSWGQSSAPGGLIGEALTMLVEEEANRLIKQSLDLQKTLDDLTSRVDGAWKFSLGGFYQKYTTQKILKNAKIIKSVLFLW